MLRAEDYAVITAAAVVIAIRDVILLLYCRLSDDGRAAILRTNTYAVLLRACAL